MTHLPSRILRFSWVLLFVWFGTQQLLQPDIWTGFLPEWTKSLPISAEMFVQINGLTEIVAAVFLLTGTFTKLVCVFFSAHLFGIAISAGGDIGARDAILAMIGIALLFLPADPWTIDGWYKRRREKKSESAET